MLSHISLCSREIVDKWWFIGSPSLFVKFYRDIDIASTICMGELYSLDEWSFVYSQGETMKGLAQNNDWLSGSSIEVPQITLHRETDIHKPEWENQTKQARHSAESLKELHQPHCNLALEKGTYIFLLTMLQYQLQEDQVHL